MRIQMWSRQFHVCWLYNKSKNLFRNHVRKKNSIDKQNVQNIKANTANIDTESMAVSYVYEHNMFDFHWERKNLKRPNRAKKIRKRCKQTIKKGCKKKKQLAYDNKRIELIIWNNLIARLEPRVHLIIDLCSGPAQF